MDKIWYAEPNTTTIIDFYERLLKVNGLFRYKECTGFCVRGEPFVGFICSKCDQIPQEFNLRMRVVCEDRTMEKRGCGNCRRLQYLQTLEVAKYDRKI
jgi:hypothetical protein